MPSFFTSFFTSKKDSEPEPLPLLARLDTVEGDMYHLRSAVDSMQGTLRKLSGKVYRGVPLGDTLDSAAEADPEPQAVPENLNTRADLYARANQLRRH